MSKYLKKAPGYIFFFVLGYLIITFLLTYLIDVQNIFGLQNLARRFYEVTSVRSSEATEPLFFAHIFKEAGPTEIFQWVLLASSIGYSAYLNGRIEGQKNFSKRFTLLFLIGLTVMLLEDSGNIRHTLTTYIPTTLQFLGIDNFLTDRTVIELIFYAILGAIMLASFYYFYKHAWHYKQARSYLIIGFCSYSVASVASATRNIGQWYIVVGERINNLIADGVMAKNISDIDIPGNFTSGERVGFLLMDNLFEESIELLGAGALLAAIISYGFFISKDES
ncbi:hypothetical protein [Natranaerobius trueperi]|uniref:Uncharacterized protein n=1 Tax=Natranaerobius trueperi TaxID=759412 RepID=A0A226C186_9FIRM|nr:hypothetical protein [Natranaerobius trueperi]OWZ84374.1 hypothetical protein CDO51_03685 [Natranaerobius trueperi]